MRMQTLIAAALAAAFAVSCAQTGRDRTASRTTGAPAASADGGAEAAAPQQAGAMSDTERRAALSAGGKGGDAGTGTTRY